MVTPIFGSSKSHSGNPSGDRFIPSRRYMAEAQTFQTYGIKSPEHFYEQQCVRAVHPGYSPRTLLNSPPKTYEPHCSIKAQRWRFPERGSQFVEVSEVVDDFYTNNLDWGKYVAVNLGTKSYILNKQRDDLMEWSSHPKPLSSLSWSPSSDLLACGDQESNIAIINISRIGREAVFHRQSVDMEREAIYAIAWRNDSELSVGGPGKIYHLDIRMKPDFSWKLPNNDNDKVCSLSWNCDESLIASGDNADQVHIFDVRNLNESCLTYTHRAAVKALSWMKGNSELLLSGGGAKDKMIKLYDARQQKMIHQQSSGSQICSMTCLDDEYFALGLSSQRVGPASEEDKTIQFWRYIPQYPKLQLVADAKGYGQRILGLAKDPQSSEICSLSPAALNGSNPEMLAFWKMEDPFKPKQQQSYLHSKTIR